MEKRTLLAVGLSVGVFILWSHFFAPKAPPKVATADPVVATQAGVPVTKVVEVAGSSGADGVVDFQKNIPIQVTEIGSANARVVFTNDGGVPVSWQMKNFRQGKGEKESPVDLVSADYPPLLLKNTALGVPQRPRFRIIEATNNRIVYKWSSSKIELTRTYAFDGDLLNLTVGIKNLTKAPLETSMTLNWIAKRPAEDKRGFLGFLKGPENVYSPVYFMDGKAVRGITPAKEGKLYWGGIEDRYFISAIIPRALADGMKLAASINKETDGSTSIETDVIVPKMNIVGGGEAKQEYSIYAGPKEMTQLKKVGFGLDKAIDYGWFSLIAVPILYLLKFFYGIIHNYGVAILLLTIFVKLLLNPLSRHSMKSMKAMQSLQPKIKALKEKYKNDKEKLNMETMMLFRANKVNPMGGCLPMLIQLPIYIALYKVLWNSIELYRAPFFWFYRDLSAPDPYFIMPVILGVAMWLQQKMTPSATADPTQAKMMQIMPIMFTAFMLFLPSGLVIYILVNTAMGVAQQWMMNHDIRFRDLVRGKFSHSNSTSSAKRVH